MPESISLWHLLNMIIISCILFADNIWKASSDENRPRCPFCRNELKLLAEHYPISSLAGPQRKEMDQLQVAIKQCMYDNTLVK